MTGAAFLNDFAMGYVLVAVLEGALLGVGFLILATGVPTARDTLAAMTAKRIVEFNGGQPVSRRQAVGDFWLGVLRSSARAGLDFSTSDISWARSVQEVATAAIDPADKAVNDALLDAVLKVDHGAEPTSVGAQSRARGLVDQWQPSVEGAADWAELRSTHAQYGRVLRQEQWKLLFARPLRRGWSNLGIALADSIGRGTALSLLVAVFSTGDVHLLPDAVGAAAVVGGSAGAVWFAARLLSAMRSVALPDRFASLHVLLRLPLLSALLFPAVVALVAIGLRSSVGAI